MSPYTLARDSAANSRLCAARMLVLLGDSLARERTSRAPSAEWWAREAGHYAGRYFAEAELAERFDAIALEFAVDVAELRGAA